MSNTYLVVGPISMSCRGLEWKIILLKHNLSVEHDVYLNAFYSSCIKAINTPPPATLPINGTSLYCLARFTGIYVSKVST